MGRRALISVLLLAATVGGAQEVPPGEPEIVFGEVFDVEMVLVPVLVRGRDGFVRDLRRDDFALSIDGRPVAIETFESAPQAPVSLIVLQDLSGSMEHEGKLETSRRAARCLVAYARSGDELAIATFAGGQTRVEVPFTGDLGTLRESIAIWRAFGTTGLYDAVAWLPDISVSSQRTRRAAVLITDGVDNASDIPPEEAQAMVREANLPLYVLGLTRSGPADGATPAANRYEGLLRALAANTGGRYTPIRQSGEVDGACAAIIEELRHQYVLGFSVAGYGSERFFTIEVEVTDSRRARGGEIIHRRSYRGTRPASWQEAG